MNYFFLALRRELIAQGRQLQYLLQTLLLYILVLCLFPLALGTSANTLQNIAPAALWIPLLLASILNAEQLFLPDYQSALLSQDCLQENFYLIVAAKICAACLRLLLPLLILLPVIALFLHLPFKYLPQSALLITLGGISLMTFNAVGAALTLNNQQTLLRFLIVMPLSVPILIFSVSASRDLFLGFEISAYYALLGALCLFSLLCALPFSTLALRNHLLP